MPFLETPHHRLHYITAGSPEQPALLMLHGFLGNHQDFTGILPALLKHFYCIVPDLPGHGQTLTQPNKYTFSSTHLSLLSLLDRLNYQQAHLLGYSMGGRIALYMACRTPSRFTTVILESASPGLKTLKEQQTRRKKDWAIAQKLETTPLSTFLDTWYKNELFATLRDRPQLYQTMRSRRQNNNAIELANALRGFSTGVQPSLWKTLPKLPNPLLLIVGEQDLKFIKIAQAVENCRQTQHQPVEVEYCLESGHNVHLEQPDLYTQIILRHTAQ